MDYPQSLLQKPLARIKLFTPRSRHPSYLVKRRQEGTVTAQGLSGGRVSFNASAGHS